jgi:hypothetical protein
MIICENKLTKEIIKFKNIVDILKFINRDRSDEWINYDETDWKEGLEVFTELEFIGYITKT